MNNFKKLGLTALAGSLVVSSAVAGEMSVSGGASIGLKNTEKTSSGKSWTMGNSVNFAGSTELDNGMTVSMAFELDQGTANNSSNGFDNHSVTIASDDFGTVKFSGHGGSSASSSIDGSVAGDIWDGFDGAVATGVTGVTIGASGGTENSIFYTAPSLMDGLAITASYNPQGAQAESETGYGVAYTGIEGLTLKYATMDENTGTTGTSGDQTAWRASYVLGSVTLTATNNDYDMGTATNDKETSSYNVSYSLTDELSIQYGTEEILSLIHI